MQTRNGTVSYLDAGEGPVALFIHGVGTSAWLWRNVIDQLCHERRCVALDLESIDVVANDTGGAVA